MGTPLIRHVRYEDFVAVRSEGASDLRDFQAAIDTLAQQIGTLYSHHILVDLRGKLKPLPEALMVDAASYLRRMGLGVSNRIAFVTDPDDEVRTDRVHSAERIAQMLEMHFRSFQDYGEALDWLNDPTEGP